MLATGLVTAFDFTMEGALLQVGTWAEWLARLAFLEDPAYMVISSTPLVEAEKREQEEQGKKELEKVREAEENVQEEDCQPTAETKLSWADIVEEALECEEQDAQQKSKEEKQGSMEEQPKEKPKAHGPWKSHRVRALLQGPTEGGGGGAWKER
jgi:hypothetical protein